MVSGTLHPLNLNVETTLPPRFADSDLADQKLKRDQHKLLKMVEYANSEGDRKTFLHDYFGLRLTGSAD